jgi:hypothetical protein
MDGDRSRLLNPHCVMDKLTLTTLEKLRVPLGGQEIELQQVDFAVGGMSLLRVRIREGRRFTVFDIDPASALAWGDALARWARSQQGEQPA